MSRRPRARGPARAPLALALLLLACGDAAGPAAGPERPVVGVSYQALRFPFVAALQRAARARAALLGLRLVEADAGNDAMTELANVESLLSRGIDCLAFEATSLDASAASIEAANAAGVPVVQFNGKANGGHWLTFVGSAQEQSGELLGGWLAERHRASGRARSRAVYLRGVPGQVTDTARSQGFRRSLARAGVAEQIELFEQFADYDRGQARSVSEALLAAHPDVHFVVAHNDDMILGALAALEARGEAARVELAGVDGLPETLARIAEGRIEATVFQDPEAQGAGAIQACADHLAGKPLDREILIPFELVTAANLPHFRAIADRVYGD